MALKMQTGQDHEPDWPNKKMYQKIPFQMFYSLKRQKNIQWQNKPVYFLITMNNVYKQDFHLLYTS